MQSPESPALRALTAALVLAAAPTLALAEPQATDVPTDIQQPGTQPKEIVGLEAPSKCDNCHGGYDLAVEPAHNWRGSMMAHASRDPIFWATVAVAESDLGGAGDLCLRCHVYDGWVAGRSTPTDGSGLGEADATGVSCDLCHQLTNPDGSEHLGTQNPPFLAHDDATPPEGWYGSGMAVVAGGGTKLGPYQDINPPHDFLQSTYHRSSEICGTCHDVSNPAVGDLAPNNGAFTPLAAGTFSGVPGTPVDGKAAFNNPPYAYGVVERTYSEHVASAFPTLRVSDYGSLPPELQEGAIEEAWEAAMAATGDGDYADGTPRFFTCQTCHMPPVQGKGCNKNSAPVRDDLPLHDMVGANYWMPDVMELLDQQGKLRLGGGLSADEKAALAVGQQRALENLEHAAEIEVLGDVARIVNLTGHKLISGYPEGRRMWLNVKWYDGQDQLVREDGAYGTLAVTLQGQPLQVQTLLDPHGPHEHVIEVHLGISQEWAAKLLTVGVPADLALEYDRTTGAVLHTLGELAAQPPGTVWESFHFALNDSVVSDNRIPPFGMRYDDALERNLLPVPTGQFGDPGAGEVYDHFVEVPLDPPATAVRAELALMYQPTSWEYVQFLVLANDGSLAFLAQEGQNLLDAWLATGMAAPVVMETETWDSGCNPAIGTYCQAKPSSAACTPALATTGLPTLSGPDDFHVVATQVVGQTTGVLYWGFQPNPANLLDAGPTGPASGILPSRWGGRLCVTPAGTLGGLLSGGTPGSCDGVLDAQLTQAFLGSVGITAGTTLYVQMWYDDPTHPDGSGVGHTEALHFTVCN
jgi:hypothetical protein